MNKCMEFRFGHASCELRAASCDLRAWLLYRVPELRAASCVLRPASCALRPACATCVLRPATCEMMKNLTGRSSPIDIVDPSKPETFMHLSRSITPIYGRGSPCQVFLKLSIKGQHPNNKFRRLLCAFI